MSILVVDQLAFGYTSEILFEDVTFRLEPGQRLAIVAPNGQGKTTLLNLIAGELEPDAGSVHIQGKKAYHRQKAPLSHVRTVHDALMWPFQEAKAARDALREAEKHAATDMETLAKAQERVQALNAEVIEREVEMLAMHIGFAEKDWGRDVQSLSGGERARLGLAAALAEKPDLLMLDEPTNHLDLQTVAWLEGHLRAFAGAIVIVSHDRRFLDNVCTHTAELGLARFRHYTGNYTRYLELRQADLERERKEFLEQRAFVEKEEEYIRRNIAGQNTKQAQGRRTRLARLARIANPEDIWSDAKRLGLRFAAAERSGDIVLDAKQLSAERGGRQLFQGIGVHLRRRQRLAIVGPNGAGKSTLLKLLAGKGAPEDRGEVRIGSAVSMAYFDQHLESLDPKASCIEEIRNLRDDMSEDMARQYLARFQFFGDEPFRPTGALSGGERTRIALAKMLLRPLNFLLLDEPTNHLDIPACEILEEALRHFDGTVIVVSHDRYFLERVSTHVLLLAQGRATLTDGAFTDVAPTAVVTKADKAESSYEQRKQQQREVEKKKRRAEQLEKLIADGEARIAALATQVAATDGTDWQKIATLQAEQSAVQAQVDGYSEEWLALAE